MKDFKNGDIKHGHPVHMDNDIIHAWYPTSFAEKIDMILMKLAELSDYVGQEIRISKYELYGLMFVEHYKSGEKEMLADNDMSKQAFFIENYLIEMGYIKGSPMAREHYMALEKNAADCISCGHCNSRCPFSVDQISRMQEIKEFFEYGLV